MIWGDISRYVNAENVLGVWPIRKNITSEGIDFRKGPDQSSFGEGSALYFIQVLCNTMLTPIVSSCTPSSRYILPE